jgi:ElaB/YqjD/DUF883 family membrane-anchored ribosome-binding protein
MIPASDTATRSDGTDKTDVKAKAADAYEAARDRTSSAYQAARDRAGKAYESARDRVSRSTDWSTENLSNNPVGAILGGFALGAILAAVIPATRREREALGGVGHKLTDAAREAARSATDAAKEQIDEISNSAVQKVGQAVVDAVATKD